MNEGRGHGLLPALPAAAAAACWAIVASAGPAAAACAAAGSGSGVAADVSTAAPPVPASNAAALGDAAARGSLPFTGQQVGIAVVAGLALVALGAILLAAARLEARPPRPRPLVCGAMVFVAALLIAPGRAYGVPPPCGATTYQLEPNDRPADPTAVPAVLPESPTALLLPLSACGVTLALLRRRGALRRRGT